MATKFSKLLAAFPKRASKIDPVQAISIFSHEVYHDLKAVIASNFPEWMEVFQEIEIVDGTLIYNLNEEIGEIYLVEDQDGRRVMRGNITSNDSDKQPVQIYGKKLTINAEATHTKLIVKAYRYIPEIASSSVDIPYPDDIVELFWKIWIKGIAYFYFRDRKKTVEVTFLFTEYEDMKKQVGKTSVIKF